MHDITSIFGYNIYACSNKFAGVYAGAGLETLNTFRLNYQQV